MNPIEALTLIRENVIVNKLDVKIFEKFAYSLI